MHEIQIEILESQIRERFVEPGLDTGVRSVVVVPEFTRDPEIFPLDPRALDALGDAGADVALVAVRGCAVDLSVSGGDGDGDGGGCVGCGFFEIPGSEADEWLVDGVICEGDLGGGEGEGVLLVKALRERDEGCEGEDETHSGRMGDGWMGLWSARVRLRLGLCEDES